MAVELEVGEESSQAELHQAGLKHGALIPQAEKDCSAALVEEQAVHAQSDQASKGIGPMASSNLLGRSRTTGSSLAKGTTEGAVGFQILTHGSGVVEAASMVKDFLDDRKNPFAYSGTSPLGGQMRDIETMLQEGSSPLSGRKKGGRRINGPHSFNVASRGDVAGKSLTESAGANTWSLNKAASLKCIRDQRMVLAKANEKNAAIVKGLEHKAGAKVKLAAESLVPGGVNGPKFIPPKEETIVGDGETNWVS